MKIWSPYLIIVVLILSNLGTPVWGQEVDCYGLSFQSYNVPPEKRTSLIIGDKKQIPLGRDFKLGFDLSFVADQNVYFGYIFRLVNRQGQRINFLFDQKSNFFRLTIDGSYAPQFFPPTGNWLYQDWSHFDFEFKNDSIICGLNGHRLGALSLQLKDTDFILAFGGGNDGQFFATDVPPMKLKDITIEKKSKLRYKWPLSSGDNNATTDDLQNEKAIVSNPVWLLQMHSHWHLLDQREYKGNASITFDPDKEQLYILAEDSVYQFSLSSSQELNRQTYASKGYHLFLGNHALFNSVDHKLYDFYIDNHFISAYSFANGKWDKSLDTVQHTEYSQANRVFSKNENALYVIGGYGQMRYKNNVQRYSFESKQWQTLTPTGDRLNPRYLASAAQKGDSIYILGGYGSSTGDQLLNPGYIYDFMVYDTKNNRFTKRFSLKRPDSALVFGSSMIIDTAGNHYYAFGFSNERYDSYLQLFRGSLQNTAYQRVADKIPFPFQDVRSEANLFWCHKTQKLLAVTLITQEDKSTSVAIYSIAFPPNVLSTDGNIDGNMVGVFLSNHKRMLLIIFLALMAGALSVAFYGKSIARKKANTKKVTLEGSAIASQKDVEIDRSLAPGLADNMGAEGENQQLVPIANEAPGVMDPVKSSDLNEDGMNNASIYLFGTFEIMDQEGNQLTTLFSPLLKELFLIILLNTIVQNTGISSKKLNEVFWRSKSDKDANNNRSVNIAKLKNILDKVESLAVVNEHSKWFVRYDPEKVDVDLAMFQALASSTDKIDRQRIRQMLSFLKKGGLLKHTEYDWLDEVKSKISNLVIDKLVNVARYLDPVKDVDALLELANGIFSFDSINEQALTLKCKALASIGRHSLAQSTYQHYCRDFQKMYGEPFAVPFSDIVSG